MRAHSNGLIQCAYSEIFDPRLIMRALIDGCCASWWEGTGEGHDLLIDTRQIFLGAADVADAGAQQSCRGAASDAKHLGWHGPYEP